MNRIPLEAPDLSGKEEKFVIGAVRKSWILSTGGYIERFEIEFAELCRTKSAISVSNRIVALHPAMLAPGVPVAMSYIPCFMEYSRYQNVRTKLFDPRNPHDISAKIQSILINPRQTSEITKRSQETVAQITWSSAAEKYIEIFETSLQEKKL